MRISDRQGFSSASCATSIPPGRAPAWPRFEGDSSGGRRGAARRRSLTLGVAACSAGMPRCAAPAPAKPFSGRLSIPAPTETSCGSVGFSAGPGMVAAIDAGAPEARTSEVRAWGVERSCAAAGRAAGATRWAGAPEASTEAGMHCSASLCDWMTGGPAPGTSSVVAALLSAAALPVKALPEAPSRKASRVGKSGTGPISPPAGEPCETAAVGPEPRTGAGASEAASLEAGPMPPAAENATNWLGWTSGAAAMSRCRRWCSFNVAMSIQAGAGGVPSRGSELDGLRLGSANSACLAILRPVGISFRTVRSVYGRSGDVVDAGMSPPARRWTDSAAARSCSCTATCICSASGRPRPLGPDPGSRDGGSSAHNPRPACSSSSPTPSMSRSGARSAPVARAAAAGASFELPGIPMPAERFSSGRRCNRAEGRPPSLTRSASEAARTLCTAPVVAASAAERDCQAPPGGRGSAGAAAAPAVEIAGSKGSLSPLPTAAP